MPRDDMSNKDPRTVKAKDLMPGDRVWISDPEGEGEEGVVVLSRTQSLRDEPVVSMVSLVSGYVHKVGPEASVWYCGPDGHLPGRSIRVTVDMGTGEIHWRSGHEIPDGLYMVDMNVWGDAYQDGRQQVRRCTLNIGQSNRPEVALASGVAEAAKSVLEANPKHRQVLLDAFEMAFDLGTQKTQLAGIFGRVMQVIKGERDHIWQEGE